MKTIFTFIAIIFFGTAAMAQNDSKEVKVATTAAGVELNIDITKADKSETEVARLYKFKNSRIKKELAFRTKNNRSKLV
ncbi:hypothetical protein GTQ34_00590 [Muricauda sp. JGD-17]|uniref:Uncharacterized protein n=1 Tax=Flagellimonas ochracea TaxID=2696472 RepID=A0A964T8Y1_9FLAO|nr:hypothetical protein [Allomuricauda ochracea]NAY90403.1 hypothetical protein [Allomuricauda ochracea]